VAVPEEAAGLGHDDTKRLRGPNDERRLQRSGLPDPDRDHRHRVMVAIAIASATTTWIVSERIRNVSTSR
jgi:hypothetical protein